MNAILEAQMKRADAVMDAHGETQPPATEENGDGRAATSPRNEAQGGRPIVDYGEAAAEFQAVRGKVRWCKGEFYQFDSERGAYRRLTEKEMGATVSGFLNEGVFLKECGVKLRYTANAEKNVVGVLRGTVDNQLVPPCFADTGKSGVGWIAMKNGLSLYSSSFLP